MFKEKLFWKEIKLCTRKLKVSRFGEWGLSVCVCWGPEKQLFSEVLPMLLHNSDLGTVLNIQVYFSGRPAPFPGLRSCTHLNSVLRWNACLCPLQFVRKGAWCSPGSISPGRKGSVHNGMPLPQASAPTQTFPCSFPHDASCCGCQLSMRKSSICRELFPWLHPPHPSSLTLISPSSRREMLLSRICNVSPHRQQMGTARRRDGEFSAMVIQMVLQHWGFTGAFFSWDGTALYANHLSMLNWWHQCLPTRNWDVDYGY